MRHTVPAFAEVVCSLEDLVGTKYLDRVISAVAVFDQDRAEAAGRAAREPVVFFPSEMQDRVDRILPRVGEVVAPPLEKSATGAPSASFRSAASLAAAPLTGYGPFRIGQDGRLYLAAKSEHYHASLGHFFSGYTLLERARALGIPNATHNNTRGHIVRRLERELVRMANGAAPGDENALETLLAAREGNTLNRVINLQTGSLAVEAALKMMLTRFHRATPRGAHPGEKPRYAERTPVVLVIADRSGGLQANYHGTTVFTQIMRGLWPDLYQSMEDRGLLRVVPVRINDTDDFRRALERYDAAPFKVAGFFHEIVLMNYGGILLDRKYLQEAYRLCRVHDVPVCVDEIQSCVWYEGLFLFREYGLQPDFVAVGKGFSGGESASSHVIATPAMDSLSQFDALVTNGQEELAALAYLVTMTFARANGARTRRLGAYYQERLRDLAGRFPATVREIEGTGLLASIFFRKIPDAVAFCRTLNQQGIDISAHTYKPNCPPAALTKLPLIATPALVDLLVERMERAIHELENDRAKPDDSERVR